MSEELLVKHCAPTLAGMKTGNLFTCSFDGACEMKECVRCWNRILTKKGLRVLPLRFKNDRALIYVYRPKMLSADLKHDIAEDFVICNEAPDADAIAACKELGAALVQL